jgi:hypothetical protein
MARLNRRHQPINGTITASGNSGALPNLSRSNNPVVVAELDVQGSVSGSLTVTVLGWSDSNRPNQLAQFTAVTATLTSPQRLVIQNVLEDYLEVAWAVSGSTPSFAGVTCDLLMTSPDA